MEERNNRLLNAKLNKYIVPGIMMSLALQLGNIVDTIFATPVYNFINGRLADKPTVLKPLS